MFHINLGDWELLWSSLTQAVTGAAIAVVRDHRPNGISCGVNVDLTVNGRRAPVMTSWHYSNKDSAPRLVTAYPSP